MDMKYMSAGTRDPVKWPHKVELRFPNRDSYESMLMWGINQFGQPDGDSLTSRWTFTTAFAGQGAFMVAWFRCEDDAVLCSLLQ